MVAENRIIFFDFFFLYNSRLISANRYFVSSQEGRKMPFNMQPLIASSPMRQESPIGMNPIEVQSYQPPWKSLTDYALHADLDRLDTSAPHFQQIVNQVRKIALTHRNGSHK